MTDAFEAVSPTQLRLLVVHAHPDDESSKGAATMAKYRALGARVLIVTCTKGERGDILNPSFIAPPGIDSTNIVQVRQKEMEQALTALDCEHRYLNYIDSGLPPIGQPTPEGSFSQADSFEAAAKLVKIVREFQPHVVITYDSNGGYPHPDHLKTHEITRMAYEHSGNTTIFPGGTPWNISKLYYFRNFSIEFLTELSAALSRHAIAHPWLEAITNDNTALEYAEKTWPITTRIECSEYFDIRRKALLAHASQVDPNGIFLACPLEEERAIWPTEDYHLAHSHVETQLPETDLFAGIASIIPA